MKFFIMPNYGKMNTDGATKRVVDYLTEQGQETFVSDDNTNHALIRDFDIVVAIGGDGTIIRALKASSQFRIPVIGVNTGRLGFLASLEKDDIEKLALVIEKKYTVENRLMIEVLINNESFFAINDVVVSKGAISKIVDIDLYADNIFIQSFRGDGVICSTPTGSTAYSMSSGGPIVDPILKSFIITPICPHSLISRSLVFEASKRIVFRPAVTNANDVYITIDGTQNFKISDERIEIKRAPKSAMLISLNNSNHFESINNKF